MSGGGLIFGSMMNGLGQGAASIGQSLGRADEREQDRLLKERMLQEQLDSRRELAALRQPAGGGANAPFDPKKAEEQYRFLANMSAEDEAKLRDGSRYDTEVDFGAEAGEMGLNSVGKVKVRRPGWEEDQRIKTRVLDEIRRGVGFGKNYKEFTEGQANEQKRGDIQAIESGRLDAGIAGKAYAATEGKPLKNNMGEAGVFDQFDGKQELNELGKAKAADESASAAEHRAKAANGGSGAGGKLTVRATKDIDGRTVAIMSDGSKQDLGPASSTAKTIASLILKKEELDSKFKKLSPEEKRRIVSEDMLGIGGNNQPTPAPAPAAGPNNPKPAPGAPKKSYSNLWN